MDKSAKQKSDLSIYFVIGENPNEYFDSFHINSYSPLSNLLLLNSISHTFYNLDDNHFKVFGIGQKKDYMLFQQTNNKSYYQLGNTNNDFFHISCEQPIKFHLFTKIDLLFTSLLNEINSNSSQNVLIILINHESHYISLLKRLSTIEKKQYFIYNESCKSGSLIDLFDKNNKIWLYFQDLKKEMEYKSSPILQNTLGVKILYYFSKLQYDLFCNFGDELSIFFPKVMNFLSENSEDSFKILFTRSFIMLNTQILQSIDKNQIEKPTKDFFLIPVDQLLDKQPFISNVVDENKFNEFLKRANIGKVKYLAHLYMIKCLSTIIKYDENECIFIKEYFTSQNFRLFLNIEKEVFNVHFADQNMNDQQTDRNMQDKSIYKKILSFFNQYFIKKIDFFEFKSNIEIISSTNLDKPSTSYCSIRDNSITKIFPNSPPFASFIRNAFFGYGKHYFFFNNFCESIERYPSQAKLQGQDNLQSQDKHQNQDILQTKIKYTYIYFPSLNYTQFEKQSGKRYLIHHIPCQLIYPNENAKFEFQSSSSLPSKIAAVRFITKYVLNYFLRIQNMEFPTLNFSCGFLKVPSDLLINFISLSILPNFNDFSSHTNLNNENFLNILKFSNFVFPTQTDEVLINNDTFKFITFFSAVLSSKIRFELAQNLISILNKLSKDKFDEDIYLFSINELKYVQIFVESKNINIHNISSKTIKVFLAELFSSNYIEKYNTNDNLDSLRDLEKSPEFNLQKMFLDLESSILNIIPSDIFILFAIYSYLILMHHSQISNNFLINQKDINNINKLFQIFNVEDNQVTESIIQSLDSFNNSLTSILQFCDLNISKRLKETFTFLQFFYKTYYLVSFCKVYKNYTSTTNDFMNFLTNLENVPIKSLDKFLNTINEKLKPLPLFCLPFILFDPNLCSSYNFNELFSNISNASTDKTDSNISNASTDKNESNNISNTSTDKTDSNISNASTDENESNNISNTSALLESNNFYSQQFRIWLSNLSLYSNLKKFVLDNIILLDEKANDSVNNISHFSFLTYFKDTSTQYFRFVDDPFQEITDDEDSSKNAIEFCNEFKQYPEGKLSFHFFKILNETLHSYIHQFKSITSDFLEFNAETSVQNNIEIFLKEQQLLFSTHEGNHEFIQNIKKNFMNLTDSLSISDDFVINNKNIEKQLSEIIDKLAFSILEARFNNKVEIEPIVKLIPEYEEQFTDIKGWNNPTNREFMALCSALPFTLSPKDKCREKIITKSKIIDKKEEEDYDNYYSPPTSASNTPSKIGDYRTIFDIYDDDDEELIDHANIYEKQVNEALNLSSSIKIYLQEKHDVRHKLWIKIIWDIFSDLFNIKLKEINLKFDLNDQELTRSSYNFDDENYVISQHFYALDNIPDLDEKESLIYSFISIHCKNEQEIKSAFVYALVASYVVLKDFTSFEYF